MNCPDLETARELGSRCGNGGPYFLFLDWAPYRQVREYAIRNAAHWTVGYGMELPAEAGDFEVAVVFLPKQRQLAEYLAALAGACTRQTGEVWLVGLIRTGARSLALAVERNVGPIARIYSGRHSRLYLVEQAIGSGVRKSLSDLADWQQVKALGNHLKIAALPGVFSRGRLDPGTRLLLETLQEPAAGRVLDFGCGCGVIGAALMKAWPAAEVELTDSDAAAVASARLTLEANRLSKEYVRASDGFSETPGEYDLIVSNPPYHSGPEVNWRVAGILAGEGALHLTRRGRLRLVTNKLPEWRRIAKRTLGEPRVLAREAAYQVIEFAGILSGSGSGKP